MLACVQPPGTSREGAGDFMTQISPILTFVWKVPAVFVLIILGVFASSQVGWSGLDVILNFQIMGLIEELVSWPILVASAIFLLAIIYAIEKLSKKSLWIALPIFIYGALIMGAWNGYWGDFDYSRLESIRHNYANAYAIEHMGKRAIYLSCHDKRIYLTDDAQAACVRILTVGPGEEIPGSEHHCGFLNSFRCAYYAPAK